MSIPAVEILNEALYVHEIVMDAILANKSTLTLGDDRREDQSKPICQDLQEDFLQAMDQTDRPAIAHIGHV